MSETGRVRASDIQALLAGHGAVRPQSPAEWTGPFPLPDALAAFYRDVGPVNLYLRAFAGAFFLPSLADLWSFQAGYRWDARTGELVGDWNDDWLVVSNNGGDPFILSRAAGSILFALHGAGTWKASEIFPDLNTMAACLGSLAAIIDKAGDSLTDDDSGIRQEHRETCRAILGDLLGSRDRADDVLATLGWT